ncbi:MAG: hypothetical protein V3W28_02150 [Thermoplasmata archaeon]
MPVVGPAWGAYVLFRIAGSLQKHLFAQWNRGPLEQARGTFRRALKSTDPAIRARARKGLDLVNMAFGAWDFAEGVAYDDPVELLADLASLGVKLHLFRAGAPFLQRILKAAGTNISIRGIEVMVAAFGVIAGGVDPKGLTRFLERFTDTKKLGEDAGRLAGETFDLLAAALDLSADVASGNLLAIPGGVAHIAQQAGDFIGALVGFAQKVEGFIPVPETKEARERTRRGFAEDLEKAGRGTPKKAVESATVRGFREDVEKAGRVPTRVRPRVSVRRPRVQPTRETWPLRDPIVPDVRSDLLRLRGTLQRSTLRTGSLLGILEELKRGG